MGFCTIEAFAQDGKFGLGGWPYSWVIFFTRGGTKSLVEFSFLFLD